MENAIFLSTQAVIDLFAQPIGNHISEFLLAHVVGKQLLIEFHAFNEQRFQLLLEDQLELIKWVYFGGFAQGFILAGDLGDLVKEKLIRFIQLGAETLVDNVNQTRERYVVFLYLSRANLAGAHPAAWRSPWTSQWSPR